MVGYEFAELRSCFSGICCQSRPQRGTHSACVTMTKASSKGKNLCDKLYGSKLNLSLSEVSVKELSVVPKAAILDLSCNKLTTLPLDFCGLTPVGLDLSNNKLQ